MTPRVPVQFHFRDEPGQLVELAGDFPDWKYPVVMTEVSPGEYRCTLELAPGIYRYKFRVNQRRWELDPHARVRDDAEGHLNAIVTVGGVAGPLHFAPDRRHVVWWEDGTFQVHAEMDAHHLPPGSVWVQGRETVHLPLRVVGRRGQRLMLVAQGGIPTDAAWFGFDGLPELAFAVPPRRNALAQPPAWLPGAVFYGIFVDRWHRGRSSPPDERASPPTTPSAQPVFYGGDLDGITEGLPYLRALGVDALVLTPIQLSPSSHRYDPTDLMTIDPRLGGEVALRRLVDGAHASGLRVVLDAAVTHVNEQHPAFQDVLRRQEESPYRGWFRIKRFPVRARDATTFEHYYNGPHLPWLDLRPGPAREHVITAMEKLVDLGIDGLRLDAMNDAPEDFWRELRARTRARNPELLLLGEIVSDVPARFAEERGVDVATDFQHREAMLGFLARGSMDARELWELTTFQRHRMGPFSSTFPLLFLDNHDTRRFMSVAWTYERLRLALTYLLTRPEPVWLTYGTEVGIFGGGVVSELDAAWTERIPMPPLDRPPTSTAELVRTLCRLRHDVRALRDGSLRLVHARGPLLIYDRVTPDQGVRVMLNVGVEPVAVGAWIPVGGRVLLHVNETTGGAGETLAGYGARLFQVRSEP
ncbi:MAG: alpha-amylase family glycosyl hydrolase [Myxococcota bacterium]